MKEIIPLGEEMVLPKELDETNKASHNQTSLAMRESSDSDVFQTATQKLPEGDGVFEQATQIMEPLLVQNTPDIETQLEVMFSSQAPVSNSACEDRPANPLLTVLKDTQDLDADLNKQRFTGVYVK